MTTTYDGIIIGGGPAGSTAAILLSRAGWSVALLEAKRFPRRKVCGECIAASNLPLLDALGVGEALRQRAGPVLRRVALWRGDESITARLPAHADRHPWGYALRREHLDLLLIEQARAAGATVLQPAKALAIRPRPGDTDGEVEVAREDGLPLTLRAPVIIRAHGSWQPAPRDEVSLTREERRPSDLLAFKANFRSAALEEGLLPVLVFAGGYGGMVVTGDGLATLACCIRRDRLIACRREICANDTAGATIEALLSHECRGVREALAGACRVGPWLAAGPIRPGVRLGNLGGSAFRIGNAAGEVHPIIGEGISMALQSAWLLCEELTRHAGAVRSSLSGTRLRSQIQQRYASRWRAHFSRRMRVAACFAHAAMRPATSATLIPLLRRAPALLSLAARMSGKTRCAVVLSPEARPGLTQGSLS
ncbi:MAG: NAD(P)/FAD-dependent oxidoreductase [Steroidobacteraceae bacterium]